jgi:MFS family permease
LTTQPSQIKPTHARHWVLLFAASLAVITYIDRVCISQAKGDIARDLHLSNTQMGWVFSIFLVAYGVFEIPGGWLGDKIGPRKVLMRVVLMWSFFTAATGWARGYASMLVARFFFGVGEAGCFPNLAKAFSNWLPRRERSRAVGLMWLSARWGGAFTPMLVFWVISHTTWRWAFQIFGVIGIVWAILFFWWFRDDPRKHSSVNDGELVLLEETRENCAGHALVPWRELLASRSVWLIWIQYMCFGYGWYFYVTWLPTYLKDARHVEPARAAFLAGFPLFFGGIGSILSGLMSAKLATFLGGVANARRRLSYLGFAGAGLLIIGSFYVIDPFWAMILMGLSSFCTDLTLPPSWDACIDVGGKYAGTVSGGMNMAGQAGGTLSSLIIGTVLDHMAAPWTLIFWLAAGGYIIGGLAWLGIDPVTPLSQEQPQGRGFEVNQTVGQESQLAK